MGPGGESQSRASKRRGTKREPWRFLLVASLPKWEGFRKVRALLGDSQKKRGQEVPRRPSRGERTFLLGGAETSESEKLIDGQKRRERKEEKWGEDLSRGVRSKGIRVARVPEMCHRRAEGAQDKDGEVGTRGDRRAMLVN